MNRDMATRILNRLSVWYPKSYNIDNMTSAQKEFFYRDLVDSFAAYTSEGVSEAYNDYHLDHKFAPTVADIREIISKRPTARKNYKPTVGLRKDLPEGWRMAECYDPCQGCRSQYPGCKDVCQEYPKRGMPCAIPPAGWWTNQIKKEAEQKND